MGPGWASKRVDGLMGFGILGTWKAGSQPQGAGAGQREEETGLEDA